MTIPPGLAPRSRPAPLHIPSLDGLRAVAVSIVFFSHVGLVGRIPGGFGVTIFFFLSGYLITTLLRIEAEATGAVSLRNFYLRRVLRIFPPMYLALAAAAVGTWWLGRSFDGGTLALQAVHVTNYHVGLGGRDLPIGTYVLWSLAVEEHFYLIFPLAYLGLRRVVPSPRRQGQILLAVCGLVLVWRSVAYLVLDVGANYTMNATDTRVDSILFGCVLALWGNPILPGPQWSPRVVWLGFAAALVVLTGTLVVRDGDFRETVRYSLQGLALAPVFVAAIRLPQRWPFALLQWAPVRWLGLVSYSLYLFHLPIVEVLRAQRSWSEPVLAAVAFALSVAVAFVVYHLIERPCARLRKRLSATG